MVEAPLLQRELARFLGQLTRSATPTAEEVVAPTTFDVIAPANFLPYTHGNKARDTWRKKFIRPK